MIVIVETSGEKSKLIYSNEAKIWLLKSDIILKTQRISHFVDTKKSRLFYNVYFIPINVNYLCRYFLSTSKRNLN